MKKCFAIVLVILFLINDFSFVSIYLPLKSLARYINSGMYTVENSDITTIYLSKNDFQEENNKFRIIDDYEILYEGELYDICSIREVNESVLIYCIKDISENSLDKIFTSHFEQKNDNSLSSTFRNIITNKRFTAFLTVNPFIQNLEEISLFKENIIAFISSPFIEIEIPPPKFS